MIKAENLSKHYDTLKAVDDISFEVAEQETMVLLGTSGCGKTSTLKMINRLVEPTSGNIYLNGKSILDQPPELLRRSIGYVLQNHGLFPHYTVAENISIVPQLLKWDADHIKKRIAELLEKLRLSVDSLNMYPSQLSGGQQQRVGLARALIADPPVLLMDEPFGALDNVTRTKIQADFKELDELKKKTIIMVTHDVEEAFYLADRICLMDKGKIIQAGTPHELLFKPANDFVKGFLKEQRLQLEFKTVRLADVWDLLPKGDQQIQANAVTADTALWTGLGSLKYHAGEKLSIQHNGEIRSAGFRDLMSAFYQYQTARHE